MPSIVYRFTPSNVQQKGWFPHYTHHTNIKMLALLSAHPDVLICAFFGELPAKFCEVFTL